MIDHISKHKSIPIHKNHASIIFQEFIPKDKSFATPRAIFASNYVFEQQYMNLKNVRDFFVHHRSKKKNLLQFLHKYHGLGAMSKIQVSRENRCTSGVTLGKSGFLIYVVSK